MTLARSVSPFSLLFLRCCPPARASVLVSQMTELVLKKIGKHFAATAWLEKEDDFLVLNNTGRIIGRIVMRARSPKGLPWGFGQLLHANSRHRSLKIITAIQRAASKQ
jgi:hypothetical protein